MKTRLDLNNRHHQLIVGALAAMVDHDGLTPREAFEVLEDIKRQTYQSLMEIVQGQCDGFIPEEELRGKWGEWYVAEVSWSSANPIHKTIVQCTEERAQVFEFVAYETQKRRQADLLLLERIHL